jgi:hypothetical protein
MAIEIPKPFNDIIAHNISQFNHYFQSLISARGSGSRRKRGMLLYMQGKASHQLFSPLKIKGQEFFRKAKKKKTLEKLDK